MYVSAPTLAERCGPNLDYRAMWVRAIAAAACPWVWL